MHISTIQIEGDEWFDLASLLSDWLGVTFTFDTAKTYRIQNISNTKIRLVESESELAHNYQEGEVVVPMATYSYVAYGSPQKLYIRGDGNNPYKVTITEENGGTIQNIEQQIGDVNSQLETV